MKYLIFLLWILEKKKQVHKSSFTFWGPIKTPKTVLFKTTKIGKSSVIVTSREKPSFCLTGHFFFTGIIVSKLFPEPDISIQTKYTFIQKQETATQNKKTPAHRTDPSTQHKSTLIQNKRYVYSKQRDGYSLWNSTTQESC